MVGVLRLEVSKAYVTVPIATDEGLAGPLELLNLMLAVSAVGGFASKVTPSTVSVGLPLKLDALRDSMLAVRLAATPAEVESRFSPS